MLKKHWLWIFAVVAGLIYLVWTARYSLMSDEIEHLHAAYFISQGLLPFKGFWEHHSPLLWVILSPFFRWLPPSADVVIYARLFGLICSGGLLVPVWGVSKLLWRDKADFSATALFFFSAGILSQYPILRPDPFMLFFVFSFLYFTIAALQEGKGRLFFASGFCMGLAFAFSPKWIAAVPLVPFFTLFLGRNAWPDLPKKNLLYAAGLILGFAPLAAYLCGNGIWAEYWRWVFVFNKKTLLFRFYPHPTFFAFAGAAVLGVCAAWRQRLPFFWLWLSVFGVVLLNTFFLYPIDAQHTYYLASFLLLVSTSASGIGVWANSFKSRFFKIILWGAVLSALILPNAKRVYDHEKNFAPFSEQLRLIRWLSDNFRGEAVVMVYPWHPIFAKDVGILQMSNFFQGVKENQRGFRDTLRSGPKWTDEIIDKKPSVIAKWEAERIIPVLVESRLVTREDYQRFISFLKSEYVPVTKYGATFLLRKGHPAAASADKVGGFTS